MSWFFRAAGSKEKVVEAMKDEKGSMQYAPPALRDAQIAAVEAVTLPDNAGGGRGILVQSNGHLSPEGGNAEFKIERIWLLT